MMSDAEILSELKKLTKIMTLSNAKSIELEITKYSKTDERKRCWCLIDGQNTSDDIAKIIKKTKRSVDIFLDILEQAQLIEKRHYGVAPQRAIDYVPSNWLELLPKSKNSKSKGETQNEQKE